MRKTLLSLIFMVFCFNKIGAESWTAPTLHYSTENIPTEAYFYHIGQQMFLTKGTTWGTHAALSADVSTAFLYQIQEQSKGVYKLYCASAANTGYLGRNSEVDLYTDYKSGNWGLEFEFYKAESGNLRIRTAASCAYYGANSYTDDDTNYGLYEMGWNPNNDDVDKSGNSLGTNVGIFMLDPTLEDIQLDWILVTPENYNLYNAQISLYNTLNEALETGYTEEELADYAALLSNDNTETLSQATTAVNQLILNYAYSHATADSPYDVTSVICNPTFEGTRGTEAEGWTDEYGNMLIQNNSAYYLYNDDDEVTTEYGLNNFAQNWTSSNTDPIAASNIYQVISDLPQGTYRLQADAVATTGSQSLEISGGSLYATSGVITYETPIDKNYYGNTNTHRYTVDITHFGGDLTIGFGFTPGYVKWFACDNFKLYYCGPVDNPGLLALTSTYTTASNYYNEYEYTYIYSKETYNTLYEELQNADEIMSESVSDDCQNEANKLNTIISKIKEEITAYNNLKDLCETVNSDITKYDNITELSEQLADLLEKYQDAYEDRTATQEQINTWVSGYNATLSNGILEAMNSATEENPVEITIFGKNMDYASNSLTEGWDVAVGTAGNSGSYNVTYHVGEVWSNTFTCLQTIDNLPAGKYTLKAKAFYRTSDNAATYEDYTNKADDILTYLVVGSAKAPVINQAAGAIQAESAPYTGYAETETGSGIWVPNSMQSAEYAFNLDDTYACQCDGYLIEDGSLTFGIRNDELSDGAAWSIWGQFQLFYSGKSNNALYNEMVQLSEQASALLDQVNIIAEADNKINEALGNADELTPSASEEELMGAINDLTEAIQYANEGVSLVNELLEAYEIYSEKAGSIESNDEELPALLEEISTAISDEEFQSNEKMTQWLSNLAKRWTAYIQYNHLNATREAPEDITAVIVNPSFDSGTNTTEGATGWTFDYTTSSGHIGYNNTTQQQNSDYAFEYWKVTAFDMQQTIVGLAEGYYHLTVNALYRAGNNSDELAAAYVADPDSYNDMSFYANNKSVKIKNAYESNLTEDPVFDGEGTATINGQMIYVPNTMASAYEFFKLGYYLNELDVFVAEGEDLTIGLKLDGNVADNNWSVFDNFTIQYLGNGEGNAPDVVQSIEAQTPDTNSRIYDLTGRRVSKVGKGIYIVNGKKVFGK